MNSVVILHGFWLFFAAHQIDILFSWILNKLTKICSLLNFFLNPTRENFCQYSEEKAQRWHKKTCKHNVKTLI